MTRKGNIRHSVSRWCYNKIPMDEFCAFCRRIGIESVELLGPSEFPALKRHGLICALVNSHALTKGLNRVEHHAERLAKIRAAIEAIAAEGWPNVICFSGKREAISDEEGIENCAKALRQVAGFAEETGVTLCMELLNSKHNHPDYQCDRTAWVGRCAGASDSSASSCSTTSITCRSWKATSSRRFARTFRSSATCTPAACPAAMKSTTARN